MSVGVMKDYKLRDLHASDQVVTEISSGVAGTDRERQHPVKHTNLSTSRGR